jgi:hypothetical protein
VRAPVAAVVALVLAGCQQERHDGAPSATANAVTTPSLTPSAVATVAREQSRHAILDAGGLSIGRNPGTAPYYPFGSPRAAVEKAGDAWLGPAQRSANDECGAGPMEFTRYGGLTLNWQDDTLVGWFAEADPALVTSDGIVPGKPLRDLEMARSARIVKDSTLEGEFDYLAADGREIGGFASGTGRDATIESLYAGVNCFFR